jgi:hypothetical protein
MQRKLNLSVGTLRGLSLMQKYHFLTIPQFALSSGFSLYHARVTLHSLEARGMLGFFGFTALPGHGKTPKVYYLTKKGWEILLYESENAPEDIGPFSQVRQETSWSPQMYHRLRLLDLFIALEVQVQNRPHIQIIRTFLEYRRVPKTYVRETTDYVTDAQTPENRIVPDGVFVLENRETARRGLFFLEMDMGTERITAPSSQDKWATIVGKFEQYDRYLQSGRFVSTYSELGEFTSFLLLFVTMSADRVDNIRQAASSLPPQLHPYYRLGVFSKVSEDVLGPVWLSRDPSDMLTYALVSSA